MRPLPLRTRLTLFYTGILALLLTALGLAYDRMLAVQLELGASTTLTEMISGLHGYLHFPDGQPTVGYDRDDPAQAAFVEEATRYYQVYDGETGDLLVESPALAPLGLHYSPSAVQTLREDPAMRDVSTDQGRLRLAHSVLTPMPGHAYLLEVGMSLDQTDVARQTFFRLLLWSIPISLLVAAVAGRWMAGRALGPLRRLVDVTRKVDASEPGRRMPVRGANDELDAVASAFNDTLGRLEHAMLEMRQFSTALAHELRTPLASLRADMELALTQDYTAAQHQTRLSDQIEEADKLTRLIAQLLTLARAEAGDIPLERRPVDLAALTMSVVTQLDLVAQDRGVALSAAGVGPVIVVGDVGWLERLLLNLLDNAIKFTPPGGRVWAHVTADDRHARLYVGDTGIGMTPETLPHVFDAFYRADPSRSNEVQGTGLGLSLVRWIADRHAAVIEISSTPGEGSLFAVTMPLAGWPTAAVEGRRHAGQD